MQNGTDPDHSSEENAAENAAEGPSPAANKRSAKDRINLACEKCRTRRAKCSGDRPKCAACLKLGYECLWPAGRRRKRTRVEMQQAAAEEMQKKGKTSMQDSLPPSTPVYSESSAIIPIGTDSAATPSPDFGQSALFAYPYQPQALTNALASTSHQQPGNVPAFTWPPASSGFAFDHYASPFDMLGTPLPQLNFGLPANATSNPSQQADLLRALESQTAIVEGDPSKNGSLDLYYYRFSGSTAFHPGMNRINLKLQMKNQITSPLECTAPLPDTTSTPVQIYNFPTIMFDDSGMPVPDVAQPLLDLFFQTASQYFPSIHRRRMEERMQSGTMSAFFLNCICAISARFQPNAQSDPTKACAPFISKAQELLVSLFHLPTTDVCTGLMLLAWASWGQDSESGLWIFGGLAIRMAIDLGIHEVSELYESEAHVVRTRLLFWSLFITDRLISFQTGRPVTISEDIIELPLPSDADFDPSPTSMGDVPEVSPGAIPFVQLTRLMVLVGRINNVLNGRRGHKRTLVPANDPSPNLLAELQLQLIEFYRGLPISMRWSVDAFKHYESAGHGGIFLMLHLWANAVLTLTYHPQLLQSKSGVETPTHATLQRSLKLSMSSARLVNDALVFADLAASQSYTASPMVVQPIFVAALAFIHEMRTAESGFGFAVAKDDTTGTDSFLASLDRQSLCQLNRALQRIEHYWAGVSFVTNILRQKEAGVFKLDPDSQKTKKVAISLPDRGILRRFEAHDPLVSPATSTSLQASIEAEKAKRDYSNMTSFSLEDLFSQYNVANTFISPASSYDVAQLLASTPKWDNL